MASNFKIGNIDCLCAHVSDCKVAYILYPMNILGQWIDQAARKYETTIVVITGMDWQNVFSPWPAKGVPRGTPDFRGESVEFLHHLQHDIVPQIEKALGLVANVERTLAGVSMSGLFALWQWMICDAFHNIVSLSGSFWFDGFMSWIEGRQPVNKTGKAYFSLGVKEPHSRVKAFDTVGENTAAIVALLKADSVDVTFESVPGDHYSDPIPRLNRAMTAIYC